MWEGKAALRVQIRMEIRWERGGKLLGEEGRLTVPVLVFGAEVLLLGPKRG